MCGASNLKFSGYSASDVGLGALADEPAAGNLHPLPPVGNASFPLLNERWVAYLKAQGLALTDLGASTWQAANTRPRDMRTCT